MVNAQLDITVGVSLYAGGVSTRDILSNESGMLIEVSKLTSPDYVVTGADPSLKLSVISNSSRCMFKIATGVLCCQVGNVIQLRVTIIDPNSPFYGWSGSMKYMLSTGSFNAFKNPRLGYVEGDIVNGASSNSDKYGMELKAPVNRELLFENEL